MLQRSGATSLNTVYWFLYPILYPVYVFEACAEVSSKRLLYIPRLNLIAAYK